MGNLRKTAIEKHSGFSPNLMGLVEPIREGYYMIGKVSVTGDAPKDFIRVYEYGEARKNNPSKWPAYIAKVGSKWYPNESITEQLMTRIGQVLGIRVADSKLMLAKGQLRFLSKYFLEGKDRLVHGSEIFSAYFEDEKFVQEVDKAREAKEFFTFQSVRAAITDVYPDYAESLMESFVEMLFFDAVVGNNDRHFNNWGVIENIKKDSSVKFSPIYDSARGLFWNRHESNIDPFLRHESKLDSYLKGSYPTTGWNNEKDLNHFELLERVINKYPQYCELISKFDFRKAQNDVHRLLNKEFREFFSSKRRCLISKCITKRISLIQKLIK